MGEHIVIHITCGKKHADLSRLPLRKVVDLVPRQKEARDISNFIDAHFGGKLGAFRSYRVKPDQVEPAPEPPGDGLVVAKQWIPAFAQSGASPPDPKSYQVRCARCC